MTPEAIIIETMFSIANKKGVDVPFILNDQQRQIDDNITGRDIIPKARQEGVSSYFLARYTAACLSKRNTRAVVISHESEATQRMLMKVKYFIDNIKGPAPVIKNNSANEITFPKTNSMFYIGTAGAKKFGRGDTVTHLHCSEFAFWPNVKELGAGLFQSVPRGTGEIAIESTGNGMNEYAARCIRAAKGQSQYKVHFLNWQDFAEYTTAVTDEEAEEIIANIKPEWEEDKLVGTLTPGQLQWRRNTLEELEYDLRKFKQEYPMVLSDCFQFAGHSIFYRVLHVPTDDWQPHEEWTKSWILKGHPNPAYTYVIGADVAAGVELDSSSIEVICVDTMEQVGEYDNDRIAPDTFAFEVAKWGNFFNQAYLVVEQNNHGLVTLSYLRGHYPDNLVHMHKDGKGNEGDSQLMRMGLKTTARTKPLMLGKLRQKIADEIIIHSELLMNQCTTFIEDENGKMGAEKGCHDDLVIAAACATWGLERGALEAARKLPRVRKALPDPFSFEEILKSMKLRNHRFPIRPQHIGSGLSHNGTRVGHS